MRKTPTEKAFDNLFELLGSYEASILMRCIADEDAIMIRLYDNPLALVEVSNKLKAHLNNDIGLRETAKSLRMEEATLAAYIQFNGASFNLEVFKNSHNVERIRRRGVCFNT